MQPESVKAIFYISEVGVRANEVGVVTAQAVAKGPYAEYAKYTPTGLLNFTCLNPAATEFFRTQVGKDVVLEIRAATEDDLITPPPAVE